MKYLPFLLLPILSLASHPPPLQENHNPCFWFLLNLTNPWLHPANHSLETNYTFAFSGHTINDLGNKVLCVRTPGETFSVVSMSTQKGLSASFGFCAPSYCNATTLQMYTDKVITFISRITKRDLREYIDIEFIDPDNVPIEKGFWLYFTIVIISILSLTTITGTFLAHFQRKQTKEKPQITLDTQYNDLREALMTNKETVNDVLSKQTAGIYLRDETGRQDFHPQGQDQIQAAPEQNPDKTPILIKILTCFDIIENMKSLLDTSIKPGHDKNLNALSGIRSIAFFSVVYGHTFMLALSAKNIGYVLHLAESTWLLPLIGAFYAVDTFFYLSGFFTGFILLGKFQKSGLTFKKYLLIIFHRWIRLWPAYALAIFFFWKLSVYLGSEVLWYQHVEFAQMCSGTFWKNLLFIDNALLGTDMDQGCFVWGWYLACDLQIFLLAPLLCWMYTKNSERTKKVILILLMVSIAASYSYLTDTGFYYILVSEKKADALDYFGEYYINPVVRMSPYLVGLWLGCMLKEFKDGKKNLYSSLKESTWKCLMSFMGGLLVLIFLVFYPRTLQKGEKWTQGFAETWSTFSRPLFVIGVFMIVAPCLAGNLRPIRRFLSNMYFVIIARLSYSGYLVHFIVIEVMYWDNNLWTGVSQYYQMGLSFAFMMTSCAFAVILYLLAEKPFANIETLFINKKKEGKSVKPRAQAEHETEKNKVMW